MTTLRCPHANSYFSNLFARLPLVREFMFLTFWPLPIIHVHRRSHCLGKRGHYSSKKNKNTIHIIFLKAMPNYERMFNNLNIFFLVKHLILCQEKPEIDKKDSEILEGNLIFECDRKLTIQLDIHYIFYFPYYLSIHRPVKYAIPVKLTLKVPFLHEAEIWRWH